MFLPPSKFSVAHCLASAASVSLNEDVFCVLRQFHFGSERYTEGGRFRSTSFPPSFRRSLSRHPAADVSSILLSCKVKLCFITANKQATPSRSVFMYHCSASDSVSCSISIIRLDAFLIFVAFVGEIRQRVSLMWFDVRIRARTSIK